MDWVFIFFSFQKFQWCYGCWDLSRKKSQKSCIWFDQYGVLQKKKKKNKVQSWRLVARQYGSWFDLATKHLAAATGHWPPFHWFQILKFSLHFAGANLHLKKVHHIIHVVTLTLETHICQIWITKWKKLFQDTQMSKYPNAKMCNAQSVKNNLGT